MCHNKLKKSAIIPYGILILIGFQTKGQEPFNNILFNNRFSQSRFFFGVLMRTNK